MCLPLHIKRTPHHIKHRINMYTLKEFKTIVSNTKNEKELDKIYDFYSQYPEEYPEGYRLLMNHMLRIRLRHFY